MKNEFSYDVLKDKYGKRVGNYKGRDVIVRSKYDDLGDNVYVLYDYNNAFIVDGYWIANVSEDGNLNHRRAEPWVKLTRDEEYYVSPVGVKAESEAKSEIELKVDSTLVDSLLDLNNQINAMGYNAEEAGDALSKLFDKLYNN